ncbi:MAG: hypothetical protein IKU17_06235 [Clostridia bacterium]|nr:hypothetical protein [Clostridia bacterium]
MLCDSNIERYIRNQYFSQLDPLPAEKRFVEKFRMALDALTLELHDDDELFGWFVFQKEYCAPKAFTDEILPTDAEERIIKSKLFGSRTVVDRGHTLLPYERILREGLADYEKRIDKELETAPEHPYLLGMKETLSVIKSFVARLTSELDHKLDSCSKEQAATLRQIRASLEKVPFSPAENLRDALQAVWLLHFLAPLAEDAWYSISLGRLDQYLYPYYLASVQNGMTKAEAKKILYNFYQLLNNYADGACLLNVGGECYNELSELLIECQKEFCLPGPILAARITEHTPKHIWDALIDEELFTRGQPTFYSESACRNALIEKGVNPEKAKTFSNNSCMGIGFPGEEFNSMWGCVFSVSAALEMAMNGGALITKECEWTVPGVQPVKTLNDLYREFERCATYLLDVSLQVYLEQADISEKTRPDCLVSLLTDDCIAKHCDRMSGATYHNVTVECMGMVNVSDGICAIAQLVFEKKKYTLEQINAAIQKNFNGFEELRYDILSCSKFGQNGPADKYAAHVAEILQKIIRSHDHKNFYFTPSLHTLDANIDSGANWGAGYDGRLAGEPFAKNGGASNFARKTDPTSMVLSAAKLPQCKFFGGQPIDISFDPNLINSHKNEIAALIHTYLQIGGLQFQVNAISSKLLRDALKNPQKHPHLIVRRGGYSVYFSNLSSDSQKEFIDRFEKEGN